MAPRRREPGAASLPATKRRSTGAPRSRCTASWSGCAGFEKRAYDLFLQNLVKGTSHLSLGHGGGGGRRSAWRCEPDDYTFAHLPRPRAHAGAGHAR